MLVQVFAHLYPRLDIAVSRHRNHLLKAPFAIHPKTGQRKIFAYPATPSLRPLNPVTLALLLLVLLVRLLVLLLPGVSWLRRFSPCPGFPGRVCTPMDVDNIDEFDPESVPTVGQLFEELEQIKSVARGKGPQAGAPPPPPRVQQNCEQQRRQKQRQWQRQKLPSWWLMHSAADLYGLCRVGAYRHERPGGDLQEVHRRYERHCLSVVLSLAFISKTVPYRAVFLRYGRGLAGPPQRAQPDG